MLFSERKGLRSYKLQEQRDYIDDGSRNILWSSMSEILYKPVHVRSGFVLQPNQAPANAPFTRFITFFWVMHLKRPIDALPWEWNELYEFLRNDFFKRNWNELYDFIELLLRKHSDQALMSHLTQSLNTIFEHENIPYRIINATITDITNEDTKKEVEELASHPMASVQQHIQTAATKLYDRKNPDFRNSIKESISAVEAICRKISGLNNATLGDALKAVEKKIEIHPALKQGFSKIYGYTSDSKDGIRHALSDPGSTVGREDARFMLVACSAFIHYLTEKAAKLKIKLK